MAAIYQSHTDRLFDLVSNLVLSSAVLHRDSVTVDCFMQPVYSDSVSSGDVSQCGASAFEDNLNDCLVVFGDHELGGPWRLHMRRSLGAWLLVGV